MDTATEQTQAVSPATDEQIHARLTKELQSIIAENPGVDHSIRLCVCSWEPKLRWACYVNVSDAVAASTLDVYTADEARANISLKLEAAKAEAEADKLEASA